MATKIVKYVQEYKKACQNCEYSSCWSKKKGKKGFLECIIEEELENLGRNPKIRYVKPDKRGCQFFMLDYNLNAHTAHFFSGEKQIRL